MDYRPEIFDILESEVNILKKLLEMKNPDLKYFEGILKHWKIIKDLYPEEVD